MLDGLEHEPGAVTNQLGKRRDGRLQVREQLGPDRDHGEVAREPMELVAIGTDVHPNDR